MQEPLTEQQMNDRTYIRDALLLAAPVPLWKITRNVREHWESQNEGKFPSDMFDNLVKRLDGLDILRIEGSGFDRTLQKGRYYFRNEYRPRQSQHDYQIELVPPTA